MKLNTKISLFALSLISTLLVVRIFLSFFPFTNLNLGQYNIHHLYLGSFLILIMVIFFLFDIINKLVIILSGISSALIVDELVYLIATDGSDLSYLSMVSLSGAAITTIILLIIIGMLYYGKTLRKRNKR